MRSNMQNSSKRPPVIVRFLSTRRRLAIALWLREKGASWAEWVAPELAEERPLWDDENGGE